MIINTKEIREIVKSFGGEPYPIITLCDAYDEQQKEIERLRAALIKLRDCDWVVTLPDRMDGVRQIAREALR